MDENAVVSVGTNKAKYAHRIPKEVMKLTVMEKCCLCKGDTIFIARTLANTKEAARKGCRQWLPVCNVCSKEFESKATWAVELLDKEISKKLLDHQAEMN